MQFARRAVHLAFQRGIHHLVLPHPVEAAEFLGHDRRRVVVAVTGQIGNFNAGRRKCLADQGRYLRACGRADTEGLFEAAVKSGITACTVGTFGGNAVTLGGASLPLAELRKAHETGFLRVV